MSNYIMHHGDCIAVLRTMDAHSVDAVVTDPPYGIRFMGKAWDGADIEDRAEKRRSMRSHDPHAGPEGGHRSIAAEAGKYDLSPTAMRAFQEFSEEWATEVMRVLKPGGHVLSFSSPRTYHRMVCGIEDAGFEIRDCIQWIFGSGFPKSRNISADMQDAEDAQAWAGWGTALKPAHEPIVVARKPLIDTIARNVLAHGTGAMHIDACRVPAEAMAPNTGSGGLPRRHENEQRGPGVVSQPHELGRWPANVIHDGSDEVTALFPYSTSGAMKAGTKRAAQNEPGSVCYGTFGGDFSSVDIAASSGSAARFFYCPKASRTDRNEGCEAMERKPLLWSAGQQNPGAFQSAGTDKSSQNNHPTVKPTDLMAYLCRLVTPAGGTVLDLFAGSGSTGKACMREGFNFIGIEREADYIEIARARIEHELQRARAAQAYVPPQRDLFAAVG